MTIDEPVTELWQPCECHEMPPMMRRDVLVSEVATALHKLFCHESEIIGDWDYARAQEMVECFEDRMIEFAETIDLRGGTSEPAGRGHGG